MHIGAIFIILGASLFGVFAPIVIKIFRLESLDFAITLGKFFGAGVITATGFIHVFPAAVTALSDPCLPEFFTEYSASAGFFALVAVLLSHLIQFLAEGKFLQAFGEKDSEEEGASVPSHGHAHGALISENQKRTLSTYILELAIGIHSVIIGMDLGVSASEFTTLLIALCFHQFFEGIGLGYRIAEIKYKRKLFGYLSSFVYAITTPLGVAIGIAMRLNQSETSASGALVTGVLDAAAAGILIYSSMLLIMEEFGLGFRKMTKARQAFCFVSFYAGCGLMATLGLWA
uniref:Zinc/iron permease n=1 Tax=Arcella intermedia TaxID=1963864 RepID=A0A6B2LCE1_9EUKA